MVSQARKMKILVGTEWPTIYLIRQSETLDARKVKHWQKQCFTGALRTAVGGHEHHGGQGGIGRNA
ncbi:hypothetical protein RvY_16209 [Ramazzottius varieornatus]|uniref:Uncharacterized protein n=1 Tax=Ramazzottius varieornatus TaxID=947166 RepID=A0A1D1VXN5_RAMVA|nr:hypothetical protein RvY_16209 [Ramazzottius varieornatus]